MFLKRNEFYNNKEIYENNFKIYLGILYFCLVVGISLLTKNSFIAFFLFGLLIFIEKKFYISLILFSPIIETVLVLKEGLTLTKLIAVSLGVLFITEMIKLKNYHFDRRVGILFLFLIMIIIGIFNAVIYMDFGAIINWNYSKILFENFVAVIPKIIFAIILYFYINMKDINYLYFSLRLASKAITLSLIIVTIYFIKIGNVSFNWWNLIYRLSFEGADPNEFSSILSAFSIFPLYIMLESSSKKWFFLSLVSYSLIGYSVYLTFSRGGILTFIFSFMLSILTFYRIKSNRKRIFLIVMILLGLLLILLIFNIIDFNAIYERFFGKYVQGNLSKLTTNRLDFWEAALKKIKDRPLLGFGSSRYVGIWINYSTLGRYNVMHSIYFEIFVQFGFVGFLLFLLIIVIILKDYVRIFKTILINNENKSIIIVPFLSLFAMLFAGLSLSWQWRELLWYFISISLSIGNLAKNKFNN